MFNVFGQLSYWQSTESVLYIRVSCFTIFQEGTFDYKYKTFSRNKDKKNVFKESRAISNLNGVLDTLYTLLDIMTKIHGLMKSFG